MRLSAAGSGGRPAGYHAGNIVYPGCGLHQLLSE